LESLLVSIGLVALAEIGDKTQLLALALAAKYRRPLPIVAGIAVATLLNHALAGALGTWLIGLIGARLLQVLVGLSFLAMAAWMLVPDKPSALGQPARLGVFLATTVAFFLVEMGDKTQIATIALGARFENLVLVTMGTTLGMMIANVPAVFFGHELIKRVPMNVVRIIAALLFLVIGLWLLAQTAGVV
jgi:putative Ca2+/H+ antiporter (TMEM165/GDT1 family)